MDGEMRPTYVERAIQTESPRHLSPVDDSKALNWNDSLNLNDASFSLTVCKRDYKLAQLPFQKPSELNAPSKRVVSLPETSPPSRIKLDTIRDRVVSMSEQVKVSLTSADNSLSSDCFESSIDSSQSQISSDIGNISVRKVRSRLYPHTPSPPSSPESVMIIGNNMHVPTSFLRRKSLQPADDHNAALNKRMNLPSDCITWPNSPPRPIPSLQGPLSLPYARCPSGAEGTIIEGEDMTRTIWGLGRDNGATREPNSEKNPLQQSILVQKPEPSLRTELPTRFHSLSSTPLELKERPRFSGKPFVGDSFSIPTIPHGTSNKPFVHGRSPSQGLGLVWNEPELPNPELHNVNSRPHLKASAPEFIPSGRLPQDSQPRIIHPARSHYIIPKPQLPAIDLAYRYHSQQEGKTPLLESPSSATWSPYLPTPPPIHMDRLPDVWSTEDTVDELRRFIYERIGQQNLSPTDLKQISELARLMNLDRTPSYPSSALSTPIFSPASPSLNIDLHHPGPPPSTPLPPLPLQRSGTGPSPNSSLSRQPRSVPFARLMQRRLPVVLEEPTSPTSEHPPPSPRIERTTFGGNTEAYRPYFARTAGPKSPHIPNVLNTGESLRSRQISSSGGEPFTSRNPEIGDFIQLGPRMSSGISRPVKSQGGFGSENQEKSRKSRSNVPVSSFGLSNKENGLAIGRSTSTDSNKSGKTFDGSSSSRETGRKKAKPKHKKQEHNAGVQPEGLDHTAWLSGPKLDAWLA
ncbi:hypothetical protein BDP27DRAFT_1369083 [Rhodocollybia butyracea]|uniref:Uncharacterized protein n=1 Tax=Rhodocollybia butyracea TaxID=206335 RepID=A0A9P5PBR5_9AGAR|nr:hypothetical protein BDP27DRAFT_1369083 [Rhodocollybia butyracea]